MRGLNNWKFEDIVKFLLDNGFEKFEKGHNKSTSHHYFYRCFLGKYYMVHVQYHSGKSIPIGTMQTIVSTSGIAKKEWVAKKASSNLKS